EINRLEAIKNPTPDNRSQLETLKRWGAGIELKIQEATVALDAALKVIDDPVKAADKEFVKLPGWVAEVIKKKGGPFTKHLPLQLDLKADLEKKKITSGGISLKWTW